MAMAKKNRLPVILTLSRSLIGGVKETYSHLGLSAFHSLLWTLMQVPFWLVILSVLQKPDPKTPTPWLFIIVVAMLTGGFLAGPANAAMLYVARLVREDEARIRDFFIGFKKYYWRTAAVYSSFVCLICLLLADIALAARIKSILVLLSLLLALYALIFLFMLSSHLFPLLVLQKNTFRKVWRKAALLTLDNGFLSFLYAVLMTACFVLSCLLPIIVVLFFPAAAAHISLGFFETLLSKYDEPDTTAADAESDQTVE